MLSSLVSNMSSIWHIPSPHVPISRTSTRPPALSSSPCGLGGRCESWCWISALCVCGAGALCPWTFHSVTALARKEHSCVLIFICIAASWGHEMRPRERLRHTDYKGRVRVRTGDERERAQAGAGHLASRLRKPISFSSKGRTLDKHVRKD